MSSVTQEARTAAPGQARSGLIPARLPTSWLGILPFFLYVTLFLLLPTIWLAIEAFQTDSGGFTLKHVQGLFQPQFENAYVTSTELSFVTALSGGFLGLMVAYAAVKEGAPGWIRTSLITFSGVAANFAGVPLAFAFVATLGSTGVLTVFLASHGVNLYANGFTLFHFAGLAITYTYFQFPLMILIISPALDGLRKEWQEAATNLGATPVQFWRWVAGPILLPSLLGAMVLLFGNAFSAYATAYALVGGTFNLVPILIGTVLSGDLLSDPQLADALALGMILIITVSVTLYALLMRRASRWTR